MPPAGTGRPLWIDDPSFNLEYHVRHTALPHPGSEEQLLRLAARIFSQQLDRSKPLWEMWMVEGLEDGGFALISKTHHALIDGIAGVDIARSSSTSAPSRPRSPTPTSRGSPRASRPERSCSPSGTLGLVRTGAAHGGGSRGDGHPAGRGPALGARRPSRASARSRGPG